MNNEMDDLAQLVYQLAGSWKQTGVSDQEIQNRLENLGLDPETAQDVTSSAGQYIDEEEEEEEV